MPVPWFTARFVFSLFALSATIHSQQEDSIRESRHWLEQARKAPRSSYDRIVAYRRAIESDPSDPLPRIELGEVFYELAIVYGHSDLFEESVRQLNSAIELDPDLPQVHYRLGTIYFLQGRFDLSREALEKSRRIDPDFDPAADGLSTPGRRTTYPGD